MSQSVRLFAIMALVFASAFISPAAEAQARRNPSNSFIITRDGRDFLCQLISTNDPGTIRECEEQAHQWPFSRNDAQRLCSGALSNAPAACAHKAHDDLNLMPTEAIELCQRARSTGPAECATTAHRRGTFTKDQAVRLCRTHGDRQRAECAITANRGRHTKEEAIRLCSGDMSQLMKMLGK